MSENEVAVYIRDDIFGGWEVKGIDGGISGSKIIFKKKLNTEMLAAKFAKKRIDKLLKEGKRVLIFNKNGFVGSYKK